MRSSLITINSILRKIILIISIFFYCAISMSVFADEERFVELQVRFEKGCQVSQGSDAASQQFVGFGSS